MSYEYPECRHRKQDEQRDGNREEFRGEERRDERRGEEERRDEHKGEQKIRNRASIEVEACGKKHKIESNELEARKINLIIKQEQNCDFVFTGDEIEYKVCIFNDSHICVRNVEFEDTFNECGEFKKDSFKVNGHKEHAHVCDRRIKYKIHELKPHEEVVITFEVFFK